MNTALKNENLVEVNIRDFIRWYNDFLDLLKDNTKIILKKRWEKIAEIKTFEKPKVKKREINWENVRTWWNWEEMLKFVKELRNEWD